MKVTDFYARVALFRDVITLHYSGLLRGRELDLSKTLASFFWLRLATPQTGRVRCGPSYTMMVLFSLAARADPHRSFVRSLLTFDGANTRQGRS